MDIRHLKYFVTVAAHENFSKAAQQLRIAQPALSRRIRMLEEELGVRLFERHLRGATLTPEGRALRERAQYLLRSFEQIEIDIRAERAPISGPVVVGMTPNFGMMVGAQLAREVRDRYPGVRLNLVEAYSPELRDRLLSGSVDIAVLSGSAPAPAGSFAVEPLFEDRLCLVGRAGDPLLKKGEIAVRQLRGLPLILTGMSSAGIRNEIETLAARRRVPLDVQFEVGSIALATQMIRLDMGYTVYVASGVAHDATLAALPITGLWLQRSLAWPVNRPLSRAAGVVLPLVRERLLAAVTSGAWKGARLLRRKAMPR
jgi:LysR family nitrogen assimilation transcriptional regulator